VPGLHLTGETEGWEAATTEAEAEEQEEPMEMEEMGQLEPPVQVEMELTGQMVHRQETEGQEE
jgi:hypothetical protein